MFVKNIGQFGKQKYFPNDDYHIIGDSAFSLKNWFMKPYKNPKTQTQKNNYILSKDRLCIEHTFGILEGRWRRL